MGFGFLRRYCCGDDADVGWNRIILVSAFDEVDLVINRR
jgi:hypothetical protein